jgi:hypothetical protein
MALVDIPSLKYTTNKSLFKYINGTVYGGSEPARSAGAEVLLAAHVDEKEIENFVNVDSTPVLSKTEYDINNNLDGYYLFERLRFPIYDNATAYTAEVRDGNNIITVYAKLIYYAATDKFYKNILASTGIAPDAINGSTYWQVILDFTNPEVRSNTNILNFIYKALYDFRGRVCTKNELYKVAANGCGCTDDINKLMPYLKKKVYLSGAKAKADDTKFEEAETITRVLEKLCPC